MAGQVLAGGLARAQEAYRLAHNPWPAAITGPYWITGPAGAPVVNRVFFSPTPPESPELYDVWVQTPA